MIFLLHLRYKDGFILVVHGIYAYYKNKEIKNMMKYDKKLTQGL
jgi:hypothetical protein